MEVNEKEYNSFKTSVINRIDRVMMDEPEEYPDEHIAFNHLAAELFAASTDEEYMYLTDGP